MNADNTKMFASDSSYGVVYLYIIIKSMICFVPHREAESETKNANNVPNGLNLAV